MTTPLQRRETPRKQRDAEGQNWLKERLIHWVGEAKMVRPRTITMRHLRAC